MAKQTEKDVDKNVALEDTLKEIQKMFGKGAVMKLGERQAVDVDVIPSGSLLLDEALGVGGYPKGRIIEIYGPESSGKTPATPRCAAITVFSAQVFIRSIVLPPCFPI